MSKRNVIEEISKFDPAEQLVLLCSRYLLKEEEKDYVKELINCLDLDWHKFLGCTLVNRVNGVVYKNIKEYEISHDEVKYFLEVAYNEQIERTKVHLNEIMNISELFENEKITYSFLKGSVLNTGFYSPGDRISNDTDLMVSVNDLDRTISLLKANGYIQGRISNNQIIPATKKDILFAKLNTYELVPCIKVMNNKYLPYHTCDINYRLSNEDTIATAEKMLEKTIYLKCGEKKIRTLPYEEFLLFLCIHHYREATMLMKIASGRDLSLYKWMDIHFFISQLHNKINWDRLLRISQEYDRVKDIYYTIYYAEMFYPGTIDTSILDTFKPNDISFLNQYKGKDNTKQVYEWKMNFYERAFSYKRRIEASENIEDEINRMNRIFEELQK